MKKISEFILAAILACMCMLGNANASVTLSGWAHTDEAPYTVTVPALGGMVLTLGGYKGTVDGKEVILWDAGPTQSISFGVEYQDYLDLYPHEVIGGPRALMLTQLFTFAEKFANDAENAAIFGGAVQELALDHLPIAGNVFSGFYKLDEGGNNPLSLPSRSLINTFTMVGVTLPPNVELRMMYDPSGTLPDLFYAIHPVPEPSTYALMGVGLLLMGVAARKRAATQAV